MTARITNYSKEAMLYERQSSGQVFCHLCSHRCLIAEGQVGICQVRENRAGTLYTMVYHSTVTEQLDPVEKKPLFHFYPGSTTYSIAAHGCNFHCQYCTNWEISQRPNEEIQMAERETSPEQIVDAAQRAGCRSIAYTYVEPTIFFELIYDTARLAREAGLANIFKTNGYLTAEAVDICQPFLDAANVDLKAFRDITYRRFGGRLQPVLDNLKRMKALGIWLEITTVVIPGINDNPAEMKEAAEFIADELGAETPWHLSRFFPAYQMADALPTPVETLLRTRELGRAAGLAYVYFGNLPLTGSQDTVCAICDTLLIRRCGDSLIDNVVREKRCPNCGALVPGIGF